MKLKTSTPFFLVLVLLSLFILDPPAAEAKKLILRLGTIAPGGTPWEWHLNKKQKDLRKNFTKRKMKVKIKTFWGGILGGEKTMVRRCRQGNLELTCATLASLAPTVPELSLMELPFLFSNDKQVDHMLDKVMLKKFKELLRQRGFIYWFWAENGWRNFATKSRLIKKPSDLKGLKMRAQENRIYINLYQVLGASPIPISVPEVLSSLQTGVVDGFDQTLMYSFTTSWYEGIKYFSLTRHIYQNVVCLISKKWADKVPKKVIDTILIGQYKDTLYSRSSLRKLRPLLRKNIAKAGIKIYQPSKKEIAAFRKASQPVYSMFRKDWGKKTSALLDKALAAIKRMK